jgi:signal transduction histidine kinase
MPTELRKAGIGAVGDVPRGMHFCHFYETKADLLDTLVPYFKAGLESNEFCLWLISEPLTPGGARRALQQAVPELDRYVADRSIEMFLGQEWYLQGGSFDVKRILAVLNEKLAQALARGYAGMRVSGNTTWLQTKDWQGFCEFEEEVNGPFAAQPMTKLCTYSLAANGVAELLDAARTHQFAIAKRKGHWDVVETTFHLRQAKQEVERLNEELARRVQERTAESQCSNQELQHFASVVSHDLQEPLRTVGTYVQLLAKRYRGHLDEAADEIIDYAVEGATRLHQLLFDLLAYSRVQTQGKEFQVINCEAVLEGVLGTLRTAIIERGAVVTHDRLPIVRGDAAQVAQVLQNLLGNALKFHGSEAPRIQVSAERKGTEWEFAVRDNGIGLDPVHAQRIFVIFQRLHTVCEYPGTGIGLAICQRIMERHGGRIWVESTPGQGATFFFTLPMA